MEEGPPCSRGCVWMAAWSPEAETCQVTQASRRLVDVQSAVSPEQAIPSEEIAALCNELHTAWAANP